jgi:hypothetical protein
MTMMILVCDCGLRVRAPGASPGRVGRCPQCGGPLRIPDSPAEREISHGSANDSLGLGYRVETVKESSVREPSRVRARSDHKSPRSMADGFLPALARPETSWFSSVLYPLRGAECLGVIASLSLVFWVFLTLVPEYCLTLMGTADSMGASLVGLLLAMISILPVVFLLPFALFYWLQYFGRILVASGTGETVPPRSPDRNFDGFFHGMSAWLIWLVLGVGTGLLPLLSYCLAMGSISACNPWLAFVLLLLALPYILIALLMTFLHDDGLAAKPWKVIGVLYRLGGSFGLLSLFIASAVALGLAPFLVALLLRASYFWIYLLVCLGCWIVVHWTSFVVARILGTYYFHRKDTLRWHRERPRWGVAWKL